MNRTDNSMIFWSEDFKGDGAHGGIMFRSMKLGAFIKECRDKGFDVVGLRFDPDDNNCEFLCSNDPEAVYQPGNELINPESSYDESNDKQWENILNEVSNETSD